MDVRRNRRMKILINKETGKEGNTREKQTKEILIKKKGDSTRSKKGREKE